MNNPFFKRSVSLGLALILVLFAAPLGAKAFTLIQLKGTDVTLEETRFTYTGEQIRPEVTVKANNTLLTLDKDYRVEYRDNTQVGTGKIIVTGIGTASAAVGYTGTVEIPFTIEPYVLKAGHVTMEGFEFPYTGTFITPSITVKVGSKVLTPGVHYALSFHNNIAAGTATATIDGIRDAGYTGHVNLNFTILPDEGPGYVQIPLTAKNVAIEGIEFPYTGKAVEPRVTVTVEGKTLVAGKDYSLSYVNNIEPGTATAIVRGKGTASESLGYSGEVKVNFAIVKAETPPETKPEETLPEETKPEETKPQETEPESVTYKITKGDKATWYKNSAKALSFTADGRFSRFEGVKIDGKALDSKYFTAKEGTNVTLKSAFLQKLGTGKHTITILFEDGQAEGAFKVSAALDTTNPDTSDNFRMGLWMSLMGLSLTGAMSLFVLRKKIF